MMNKASVLLAAGIALLLSSHQADAFMAPAAMSLRAPSRMPMINTRSALRMAEDTEIETETPMPMGESEDSAMRTRGLDARRTSFFSRNLSEEKLTQRTFYDIEERGELLIAPDRQDEWGEELTEMGKWQRTNGPVYVQSVGGVMLLGGFVNYFALANANGLSSALWTSSVLVSLLGFALQRKTD
mmetsp:Transcript_11615/g.9893  ORF Transcript_11615/g.9893 Transcript_11615/m.9893 type:complete len:185 (+) Transcript_11615:3-557(+)